MSEHLQRVPGIDLSMKFAVLFLQELLTMGPLPPGRQAWTLDPVLCLGLKSSSSLKVIVRSKSAHLLVSDSCLEVGDEDAVPASLG